MWSVEQYNKFKADRERPVDDLLSPIKPEEFDEVLDLGCGTGAVTQKIARATLAKHTFGIDSSESMLSEAQNIKQSNINFIRTRIETYGVPMENYKGVTEWVKGTMLRGYKTHLSGPEYDQFENEYIRRIKKSIGDRRYYFAFKRMLLWGRKLNE